MAVYWVAWWVFEKVGLKGALLVYKTVVLSVFWLVVEMVAD
jgi:hypothetical protein